MRLHKGFTLLEVLISLFIFTIISMIITAGLHTVLNNQVITEKRSMRLMQLQTTLILLSRDLEQTLSCPVINNKNMLEGFVGTPTQVTFTHTGWANPLGKLQRSTLQRTQYQLDKNTFIRIVWPVLDQTAKTQTSQRQLLEEVESIHFEYLDHDGLFHKEWPVPAVKEALPKAVRITITIKQWGKLSQLYLIPAEGTALIGPMT